MLNDKDRVYYERRALCELERAEQAENSEACLSHYILAAYYAELLDYDRRTTTRSAEQR